MKIDEKKFNNLNQLDRIEFRQKLRSIQERNLSIENLLLSIFTVYWVLAVGAIITNNSALINLAGFTFTILFGLVFIEILFIISFYIIRKKLKEKLIEEYFSIGVKK